jgi:hypothetical protein
LPEVVNEVEKPAESGTVVDVPLGVVVRSPAVTVKVKLKPPRSPLVSVTGPETV